MKYYHGTARKRGAESIEAQIMPISRGDDHWLGDGIYFYDNINLNHSFQTPGVIYMYLTDKQACSSIDIYNETAK